MKLNIKVFSIVITMIIILITLSKLFKPSLLANSSEEIDDVLINSYIPEEIDDVLINPYMGWAPSALYTSYTQPHSLVYANIYWSDIEPTKGQYDFDYLEEKYNFKYWKSKDVKIILRLIMDYPNSEGNKQIPNWLYEEIDKDGTWYDIDYGIGFSPNYSNSLLINYHNKLIQALGERYNNSDDIAFIALGSIGHWGEWHTYQSEDISIPYPNENTANEYVKHYLTHFDNKKILMRRPFNIAKENNLGLFNDMLGHEESTNEYISWIDNGYYDYLFDIDQPDMKDFWKYSISGGEFASGNSGLNYISSYTINSTIKQIKDTHISFIGPNCPSDQDDTLKEYYDTILKTLGYRFVIKEVNHTDEIKSSNSIKLDITIENKGVAPFYFDWPVKVVLLDENNNIIDSHTLESDIRTWMPGKDISVRTKFKLDENLNEGKYTLALGVIDQSTGKPSIKFANSDEIIPYYYKIGEIIKR